LLSRISGLPPLRGTLCKSVNTRVANYSSADIKVTREDTIKKGTLNELKKKNFLSLNKNTCAPPKIENEQFYEWLRGFIEGKETF
jgi:hypothetical protein